MARTARKTPAPPSPPPSGGLGLARRGGQGKIFTSGPVPIGFAGPDHRAVRVDLELDGLFHGEASYEGRVFLDNASADATTPKTAENGYAGSFHVFGHGGCLGDPGHCDVRDHNRDPLDLRPGHMLTPLKTRVNVTKMVQAIAAKKDDVKVTIVPVITAANELCDKENVLRFDGMRFVSYNP